MDKLKRFLAIAAVIVLVLCALATLVFAILGACGVGDFSSYWKASAWCMVVAPALLYAMVLIARILGNKEK